MVATATEIDAAIEDLISRLKQDIRLEAILLFGSYANGVPHEWSDVDIAVISPDFEGLRMPERQKVIAAASRGRNSSLAPLGYPSSEYHDPGPHSFVREIIRTGRVVYGAASSASTGIAAGR